MIFFSKNPVTKSEKIAAQRFRDIKALVHKQHIAQAQEMQAVANKSSGYLDNIPDAGAGLDEDFVSKVGAKKQRIKEAVHHHKDKFGNMRKRIRKSRKRSRSKAKELGF